VSLYFQILTFHVAFVAQVEWASLTEKMMPLSCKLISLTYSLFVEGQLWKSLFRV